MLHIMNSFHYNSIAIVIRSFLFVSFKIFMFRNTFQFAIGYFHKGSISQSLKNVWFANYFFLHVTTVSRVVEIYVRCTLLFSHTTYNRRKILNEIPSHMIELLQPLILKEFVTLRIGLLIILQNLFSRFSWIGDIVCFWA